MNRVQWNNSNINNNVSQLKSTGCEDASTDTEISEANQILKSSILSYDRYSIDNTLPQEVFNSNNHSMSNRDIKMTKPRKQSTAMSSLENALNEMSMAIRHVEVVNKQASTFLPRRILPEQKDMANCKQRTTKNVNCVNALVSPRMYNVASQRHGGTHTWNGCEKSDTTKLCGTEIRPRGSLRPQQVKVGRQSQPRMEFQQSKMGYFHQEFPAGREMEQRYHSHAASSSADCFPSQEHRNTFQEISDRLRAAANVQHACVQPNSQHQSNIDRSTRQSFTAVAESDRRSCGPLKPSEACLASTSSSDVYSISKRYSQARPYEVRTSLGSAKGQAGSLHRKVDMHQDTTQSPESIQGLSRSSLQQRENCRYQINSEKIQNSENASECEHSHFNCSAVTDIGEEVNGFPATNVYNSIVPGNRVEQMQQGIERNTIISNVSRSSDLVMPKFPSMYEDATSGDESNKIQNQAALNRQLLHSGLLTEIDNLSAPMPHAAAQYSEIVAASNSFRVPGSEYRNTLTGRVDTEISKVQCTRQDGLASIGVSDVFQGSNPNDDKKSSLETLPHVQVSEIAELVNKLRKITSGEDVAFEPTSIIERSSSEINPDNADSVYIRKSHDFQTNLPVIDEAISRQIKNCSLPPNKTPVVTEPAVSSVELQYVNLLTGDGSCGSSPITLRSSDGELIILGKEKRSCAGTVTSGGLSEAIHIFSDNKQSDKGLKDPSWSGSGHPSHGSSTNGKGDAWSLAILKPGASAQIFKFQTV